MSELSEFDDIRDRLNIMNQMIVEALEKYQKVIQILDKNNEKVAVTRFRTSSKHLASWLAVIDKFKNYLILYA